MSSRADTYSLTEAAERLGKSRKTIIRWRKDGKFPNAQLLPGNRGDEWRIPVTDLDELTESEDETRPGTQEVPQGETLSALVTQVTDLSLELGQTQGQRGALVSQVDEQTRRIQQLVSDLEQERTAHQQAETGAARAVGERDALNDRVSDLTTDRDRLSTDLAETRESAAQETKTLEADIINLRDDHQRALTAMGRWSRRKYERGAALEDTRLALTEGTSEKAPSVTEMSAAEPELTNDEDSSPEEPLADGDATPTVKRGGIRQRFVSEIRVGFRKTTE